MKNVTIASSNEFTAYFSHNRQSDSGIHNQSELATTMKRVIEVAAIPVTIGYTEHKVEIIIEQN